MGRPNFKDTLHLPGPAEIADAAAANEEVPGPRAEGPVPKDEALIWIYVWIIQNGPNHDPWAAAAYGEYPSESHSESPDESPEESPPLSGEWAMTTEMAHVSDPFRPGPALATAMALVDHGDGTSDVDWWTEAIMIAAPKGAATP